MSAKEKLYDNVLKACEEEFKDKISLFNQLDTKAQQVAGFSGVLLGVLFSFCKQDVLVFLSKTSPLCIVFSIISLALLLIAIGIDIYSMRIMRVTGMPTFEANKIKYKNLIQLNQQAFVDEYLFRFISKKIEMWEDSFISIEAVNRKKANCVFASQILFGCGVLLLGLIAILILKSYL